MERYEDSMGNIRQESSKKERREEEKETNGENGKEGEYNRIIMGTGGSGK